MKRTAYYGSRISDSISRTPEGFLICRDVPIARVGVQEYLGREIGQTERPDDVFKVNRPADEVFSPAAIASFEGKPLVDNHPDEDVTAENFGQYMRGVVRDVRKGTGQFDGYLVADIVIHDGALARAVQDGGKASEGYSLKTQGANIDDQVANLKEKWKEALPAIGGILKDAGMGDSQISSGARTAAHNATISGASPTSWHIDHGDGGDAVDIVLPDDTTPEQANAILQYFKDSGAFHEVLFHDAGTGYHLHLGGYIPGKLEIANNTKDKPTESNDSRNMAQSHPEISADKAGITDLLKSLKGRRGQEEPTDVAAGIVQGEQKMTTSVFPDWLKKLRKPKQEPVAAAPVAAQAGFVEGEQQMVLNPIQEALGGLKMPEMPDFSMAMQQMMGGFNIPMQMAAAGAGGGDISIGGPVVTVNISGTNAGPDEIQKAVTNGVNEGMMDTAHIFSRLIRRPTI